MVAIYVLRDTSGTPFYIGATKDKLRERLNQHIHDKVRGGDRDGLTKKRKEVISRILNNGGAIEISILAIVESFRANESERHYYNLLTTAGYSLLQHPSAFTYSHNNIKSICEIPEEQYSYAGNVGIPSQWLRNTENRSNVKQKIIDFLNEPSVTVNASGVITRVSRLLPR